MLNNYFTLRYLSLNLDKHLRQRLIVEAFSQTKDTLALRLKDYPDTLIISCRPGYTTLYLHPRYTRATANTVDVLNACRDRLIRSISLHPDDRILSITLDGDLSLQAHLFGPTANILLVDGHSTIIDAFKNRRKLAGSAYEPDLLPSAPAQVSVPQALLPFRTETLEVALRQMFPRFGSTIVRESLFRSHISPQLKAAETPPQDIERVDQEMQSILGELENPQPRIYRMDGTMAGKAGRHSNADRSCVFSIIRLQHLEGFTERLFDDIHEAIRVFIASSESTHDLERRRNALLTPLIQFGNRTQRAVKALQQDLNVNDRPDRWERFGSLLMAHLAEIHKGMSHVLLDDGGSTIDVPLDPALTPRENAQRYFTKAKRSRLAQEEARHRLGRLSSDITAATDLHSSISLIAGKKELKQFIADHEADLRRFGIMERNGDKDLIPFRVFTVEGGFEVLAGKNSESNDLLTLKHAKPNDLWFHARGSSGSHVVLRIGTGHGEPSKRAKEQAASIAAYYSKMRTAKLVPVAMTVRKYVRKPKGSLPGTVLLEREKVIFAEPELPSS